MRVLSLCCVAAACAAADLHIQSDGADAIAVANALSGGGFDGVQPDGSYVPSGEADLIQPAPFAPRPSTVSELERAQVEQVPALVLDNSGVYHTASTVGETLAPLSADMVGALSGADSLGARPTPAPVHDLASLARISGTHVTDTVQVPSSAGLPVYEVDPLDDPIAYTRSVFGNEKHSVMAGRDGGPLDEDVSDKTLPRAPAGIAGTLQLFGLGYGTFTNFERYRVRSALGAALGPPICMYFKQHGMLASSNRCNLGKQGFDIQIERTLGPMRTNHNNELYVPLTDAVTNKTTNGVTHVSDGDELSALIGGGGSVADGEKAGLAKAVAEFKVLNMTAYEVTFRLVFGHCSPDIERTLQILPALVQQQVKDGKLFRLLKDLHPHALGLRDVPFVSSCKPLIKLSLPSNVTMKDSKVQCFYDGRRVRVNHLPSKLNVGGLGKKWTEEYRQEHRFFCKHYVDIQGYHRCSCKSWLLPGEAAAAAAAAATTAAPVAAAPNASATAPTTTTTTGAPSPAPTPAANAVIDDWWSSKLVENELCVMSPWGKWQHCSKECNGGLQSRHRAVMWRGPQVDVSRCPAVEEHRTCNVDKCPWPIATLNCSMSAWESWAACSKSCGTGYQKRNRRILFQPHSDQPGGHCAHSEEFRTCNSKSCPAPHIFMKGDAEIYMPVSKDPLDKYVDAGAVCTDEADGEIGAGGGKLLDPGAMKVTQAPPVDLHTPGTYRIYYNCHNKQGLQAKTLTRIVHVANCVGGGNCEWPKSPIGCILAPFGGWEVCSRTCGGGMQYRALALARKPQNGGASCAEYRKGNIVHEAWSRPCNQLACPKLADMSEPKNAATPLSTKEKALADAAPTTSFPAYQILKDELLHANTPAPTPAPTPYATFGTKAPTPPQDTGTLTMGDGCIYSAWGAWDDCSKTCSGGSKTRFRVLLGRTEEADLKGVSCNFLKDAQACNAEPCTGSWSYKDRVARISMVLVLPKELPFGQRGEKTFTAVRQDTFRAVLGRALGVRAVQVSVETLKRFGAAGVAGGVDAHVTISLSDLIDLDRLSAMVRRHAFERVVMQSLGAEGFLVSQVDDLHAVVETGAPTPAPVACELHPWGGWSECSKTCMAGVQSRERKVAVQPAGRMGCLPRFEYKTCNDVPCVTGDTIADEVTINKVEGVGFMASGTTPPPIDAESSFLSSSHSDPAPDVVDPIEVVDSLDNTGGIPQPLEPLEPLANAATP